MTSKDEILVNYYVNMIIYSLYNDANNASKIIGINNFNQI